MADPPATGTTRSGPAQRKSRWWAVAFWVAVGVVLLGVPGILSFSAVSGTLHLALGVPTALIVWVLVARRLMRRGRRNEPIRGRHPRAARIALRVFHLFSSAVVGVVAAAGLVGFVYLINGVIGEQTAMTHPCTVRAVERETDEDGGTLAVVYCRLAEGEKLFVEVSDPEQAEAALARLEPGRTVDVRIHEGSLGLWYTLNDPLVAMPPAAE